MGRWLPLLILATSGLARADVPPCPAPAIVSIQAENLSADDTVSLRVRGELLSAATDTCAGGGKATYDVTLTCAGPGTVSCGTLPPIQPGLWVHHVDLQVSGSYPQHQSQRSVVLASTAGVSNVVTWTIFPHTFVVTQAQSDDFTTQLGLAAAFTAWGPDVRALVTFDPKAFPGALSPTQVLVGFDRGPPKTCQTETCSDGLKAALCLTGSRITVDALDDLGQRGGVVLVNGTCERYLLRIYGSDNVLRGLELRGIEVLDPNNPSTAVVDTLAIVGSDSQRNRIEQCTVRGGPGGAPGRGDALSVGDDAGTPGGADHDAVIIDSEITGAQDKGIKVVGGGHVTVQTSCVHDNMNGGIQATEGGNVTAIRNVVQLNRLGPAENGLLVGVPNEIGDPNTMNTDGNVVRFSGARGISVVNAGTGTFTNDFVAENEQSGIRVETTMPGMPGPVPAALLRGVGLACNHKRVSGTCLPAGQQSCIGNSDCMAGDTCQYPPGGEPAGVGASVGFGLSNNMDLCSAGGCANPTVDLGTGGRGAGRNALAQNPSPIAGGVNLSNQLTSAPPIPARGNQWQDCGDGAMCNVSQVQAIDLRPPGTTAADIGTPTGPGGGPAPAIVRIEPARPRAGDFVRVYNGSLDGNGGTFNAIDGAACTDSTPQAGGPNGEPVGLPSDPCSPESPKTATQNHTVNRGNRVAIALGGQAFDVDVHAVTPTMLIFEMPVDCFAAGTLTVTRGNDAPSAAVALCDPTGCADAPAGTPCDDGNACTQGDQCDGNGACVSGSPLDCSGPCQACDPQAGCVPKGDGAACDDGNSCTMGDHCSGTACVSGTPVTCAGPCVAGTCTPGVGCQPLPASTSCDDGTACTVGDHCSGTDGTCIAGAPLACDDGNSCTADACDMARGCTHVPLPDGTICPAIDRCHGPAQCRAGVCDSGPALQCNDGDFCTDDLCDPQQGCVYPQVTGIRRTSCRIDELRALLRDVPTSVAMGRRLGRRLDAVEAALANAQAATKPAQQRRQLKKARGALQGFLGAIRRGRRVLGGTLERQLERSVKTAIGTLTPS